MMNFHHRRRSVPQLNTTSTADISFMLLIFFLVTTNMDVDKGITRQLPPQGQQQSEQSFVEKSTVLDLQITGGNQLLVDGKPFAVNRLQQRVEAFVTRLGKRHLIKVSVDPQASYDIYFHMQNQLVDAYRNLRDRRAMAQFGRRYAALSQDQRDKVKDEIPQRIAEQYNGSQDATQPTQEGGQP